MTSGRSSQPSSQRLVAPSRVLSRPTPISQTIPRKRHQTTRHFRPTNHTFPLRTSRRVATGVAKIERRRERRSIGRPLAQAAAQHGLLTDILGQGRHAERAFAGTGRALAVRRDGRLRRDRHRHRCRRLNRRGAWRRLPQREHRLLGRAEAGPLTSRSPRLSLRLSGFRCKQLFCCPIPGRADNKGPSFARGDARFGDRRPTRQ